MKKLVALTLALLAFCACGCAQENQAATSDTIQAEKSHAEQDSTENAVKPKEYIPGYEDSELYQKLAEIEQCTSPDELATLLTSVYGEKITYQMVDVSEQDFLFNVCRLYDGTKQFYIHTGTVYAFFKPMNETPVFIQCDKGAYIVGNYEIHNFDDGTHCHSVTAWSLTDHYLCLHEYTYPGDDPDDVEWREYLSEAVSYETYYTEFEALLGAYLAQG